jgi:hypothetical protein
MKMKLGVTALVVGGIVGISAGFGAGCGGSSGTGGSTGTGTTTATGTTGSTATSTHATTGAGTTTGTTGSGTTTGTGGGNDCMTMCADIKAACTGTLFPYASDADCATKCAGLMPGTPGATTGNTIACRIYHATAAAADATAAMTHCPHTGVPAAAFCL